MAEWTEFLNASIFPMALSAYLVIRVEKTLNKNTEVLIKLAEKVGKDE